MSIEKRKIAYKVAFTPFSGHAHVG